MKIKAEPATVTQVVETQVPGVKLELPREVAVTLLDIMLRIGGCTSTSRRKHADAIASALRSASIQPTPKGLDGRTPDIDPKANIFFT